ncbi:MAG: hypothetical protein JSV65_09260 [Armatimonadota bacterium]|nr:MAG: hypothetical protein JSV65_09260 [Armatimonadota bacterium]
MMDFSYRSPTTGVHRIRGKFTRPHEKQAMRIVVSVLDFPEPGKTAATGLALSEMVYADQGGSEHKASIGRSLARAAADEVVRQLDDGDVDNLVHPILRKDAEWLDDFRRRACEFQRKGARALICTVARDPQESHVAEAECEHCPLPEYWERCRHLVEVQTYRETAEKQRRDLRCAAKCARGETIGSPGMCRPGGRACFAWGLFTRAKSGLVVPMEEMPLRRVPGGPGR